MASETPRGTIRRGIVLYPDPVLLRRARPVDAIDGWVRELIDDMVRVMREEEGAGIAAPQVGEDVRIFVVEARPRGEGESAEGLGVYINPNLVEAGGAVEAEEEGCLSLPGIRADILRPPTVTIEATDLENRTFRRTASGMLARIWQHEFDHLEGRLILDRLSPRDRLATRRQVKALRDAFGDR